MLLSHHLLRPYRTLPLAGTHREERLQVHWRNVSSYDIGGGISHREVEEMIGIAQSLQHDVEQWIPKNHASLLQRNDDFFFLRNRALCSRHGVSPFYITIQFQPVNHTALPEHKGRDDFLPQ